MSESNQVLYPMWYSLYSAYLYNLMYIEQANKLCKEKKIEFLSPAKVDKQIIQQMKHVSSQSPNSTAQQRPNVMRRIGYKTKRAGFVRRLLADVIDQFFVSFILIVSINSFDVAITDILSELHEYSARIFSDLYTETNGMVFNDVYLFHMMFVLSISSLFIRLFVFVYEWISVWLYGTTIGKLAAGLQVVECVEVISQIRDFIIVKPGIKVGFYSSLKRSAVKNILRHFVPLVLCFVTTRGGRTLYDESTSTAVVLKRAYWEPKFEQAE